MQCNTAPYIIGHGKHRPCKNRAETVQPWLTKQKSHEIFRSTASTVDIPNHWDLQQRRLRPVADARRSCWGSGQQDASAAQGTRRMLGAATRNFKQQPTGLIACGAVRRRLVRAPSIVQTKRKTSTQRVLVFLGAMEGTRTPGLLIRSARRAIPSIFGSYVLSSFPCDTSQVLNFEFLHPLFDFATICTLCTF